MTDPLAFRGTYADWKLIKTRGVVQVVMEVPLSDADAAYKVLGGMPDASREVWFAIAPLKSPQAEKENETPKSPAAPQPTHPQAAAKRDWRDFPPSTQSGTRCNEPTFRAFLGEEYGFEVKDKDQAAIVVRQLCKVESRREFDTDQTAKARWQGLDDQFLAWKFIDA